MNSQSAIKSFSNKPFTKSQSQNKASGLESLLGQFDPISLSEMNQVALLRRTDTKYLLTQQQLQIALKNLSNLYYVLKVSDKCLNQYQTLYFDTPDFKLYQKHHDGALNRYKVRSREYVDSQLTFLETKFKNNKQRTLKSRLQTEKLVTNLDANLNWEASAFIHSHYPASPDSLEPKLWTKYYRFTMVSKYQKERLTVDIGLHFDRRTQEVSLPGIVIAEVKQERFSLNSDFIQQMRKLNVRPVGFSKYCVGVAMLYDQVKRNNFKPKIRMVNRLMKGSVSYVQS